MNEIPIACPTCKRNGEDKILAHILPNGMIAVARYRKKFGNEESTLIKGNDYTLVCGFCMTEVYYQRKEEYDRSYIGPQWILSISFVGGSAIQRTQSLSDYSGTSLQSSGTQPLL